MAAEKMTAATEDDGSEEEYDIHGSSSDGGKRSSKEEEEEMKKKKKMKAPGPPPSIPASSADAFLSVGDDEDFYDTHLPALPPFTFPSQRNFPPRSNPLFILATGSSESHLTSSAASLPPFPATSPPPGLNPFDCHLPPQTPPIALFL